MDSAEGEFRERKRQRAALCHLFVWCYLFSVAGAVAQQAAQLPPLSQRARQALKMGKFKEAQEAYEEIIKHDSRSPEAYSNLGLALYMQGRYPGAITALQKALQLDPDLRNTVVLLALSYFSLNEFGKAVPFLEKAYTENKDDPILAQHLGLAYLRLHEDAKALAALSRWVELEPTNPDALYYT
jgi:tetratricopeptide (TPR) repeat protein